MTGKPVPILETVEVTKSFGDFVANDRVSLSIAAGEIHALLGENGAGKSTLVKALFGVHRPDSGSILWRGRPVEIGSPARARELGIGMVFQHFSLFDALTVAENVAVALPADYSVARVTRELAEISGRYGLPLNPHALVADLSSGQRQRVEIVRCLMQNPDLVIMDEPTSVLTPQEAEDLFAMLERLTAEGRAVLYISHKLDEVRRLCQHATVLRHGRVVGSCVPAETDKAELARMMVGETVHAARPAGAAAGAEVALRVRDLSMPAPNLFGTALKNISFTLPAGQVSAIAGIAGNGQGELFAALSGESPCTGPETIAIFGRPVGRLGITARRRMNADFISEDRLGHATAPDMTLSENVLVTRAKTDAELLSGGILRKGLAGRIAARIRKAFDVGAAADDPAARALSGGNLQKFIIGRAVDRAPALLVVDQPTWGVDAGAAAHIRRTLVELARGGAAILVISQDLDEIYEIADRIAVLCEGRLTDFHPAADLSTEQIGLWMSPTMAAQDAEGAHLAA